MNEVEAKKVMKKLPPKLRKEMRRTCRHIYFNDLPQAHLMGIPMEFQEACYALDRDRIMEKMRERVRAYKESQA